MTLEEKPTNLEQTGEDTPPTTETELSKEQAKKPLYVRFDNDEPGHPGVTVWYNDGTSEWCDARGRRDWEKAQRIPPEECIDNLPEKEGSATAKETENTPAPKNKKPEEQSENSTPDFVPKRYVSSSDNEGGIVVSGKDGGWFDKSRIQWERDHSVPTEERIENLPHIDELIIEAKSWEEMVYFLNEKGSYWYQEAYDRFPKRSPYGHSQPFSIPRDLEIKGETIINAIRENKPGLLGEAVNDKRIYAIFQKGLDLTLGENGPTAIATRKAEAKRLKEREQINFPNARSLNELRLMLDTDERTNQNPNVPSAIRDLIRQGKWEYIPDQSLREALNRTAAIYFQEAKSMNDLYQRIREYYRQWGSIPTSAGIKEQAQDLIDSIDWAIKHKDTIKITRNADLRSIVDRLRPTVWRRIKNFILG